MASEGRFMFRSMSRTVLPLALFVLHVLSGAAVAAGAPPIACRAAHAGVERNICGSAELLAMDREIAALYDRGLAQFTGAERHRLVMSQQSFLRRRGGCDWAAHHSAHPGVAVEECVRGAMEGRVHALRDVADRGRMPPEVANTSHR